MLLDEATQSKTMKKIQENLRILTLNQNIPFVLKAI